MLHISPCFVLLTLCVLADCKAPLARTVGAFAYFEASQVVWRCRLDLTDTCASTSPSNSLYNLAYFKSYVLPPFCIWWCVAHAFSFVQLLLVFSVRITPSLTHLSLVPRFQRIQRMHSYNHTCMRFIFCQIVWVNKLEYCRHLHTHPTRPSCWYGFVCVAHLLRVQAGKLLPCMCDSLSLIC